MQLIILLVRVIFIRPPKKITHELLLNIIFKVVKLLYKILEVNIY